MPGYVSANTIYGHPLSGSGKLVPNPVHQYGVERYFVPTSAQTDKEPTFYGAPNSIFITKAEPVSLYFNSTGATPTAGESGSESKTNFGIMPIGHYDLHPTAVSASTAGTVVFIYKESGY